MPPNGSLDALVPAPCLLPSCSHSWPAFCQCHQCLNLPTCKPGALPLVAPRSHSLMSFNNATGKPRIHVSWGGWWTWLDGCCPECDSGRGGAAAPLECGERLQFNPLYPPKASSLLPCLLAPILCVQEELHSHAEGKSEEEKLGRPEEHPPSQPAGLSVIAAVPLCGAVMAMEASPPGTLMPAAIQGSASCSRSPSVTGVSSGAMWEGYRRLCPPPPSVHLQATVCVARELGEKERKIGRRREREKGRYREKDREKERERERGRKREKGR
ncbi:hypothetical protein E2320_003414 [Naja naja]|nr:hypothetical protein E2320_003414 [Naja naja]